MVWRKDLRAARAREETLFPSDACLCFCCCCIAIDRVELRTAFEKFSISSTTTRLMTQVFHYHVKQCCGHVILREIVNDDNDGQGDLEMMISKGQGAFVDRIHFDFRDLILGLTRY